MSAARLLTLLAVLAVGGAVTGCTPSRSAEKGPAAPPAAGYFTDLRPQSGVDFDLAHHKEGLTILETLGHGAGLCDFDGDGNLDLVLVSRERVALYKGDGHFHFTDVTPASGLRQPGYWEGIATGDFDGDGKPDLYLCGYDCSALYRNLGGMKFEEVTKTAGVGVVAPKGKEAPEWRSSAIFFDADGDGKLDLYVCRYAHFGPKTPQLCDTNGVRSACDPQNYKSQIGVFYHNLGGGRFADETKARGFDSASGHALGVQVVDYDGDGKLDLAVANDERPGDLFHNRGGGKFEQKGPASGTAYDVYGHVHAGMGIDWCDYDRDGQMDMFVTTFQNEEKNLYRNIGKGLFMDMGLRLGISRPIQPLISWGTRFLDYDNDGWSDLVVASGHVQDQAHRINAKTDYPQPLLLFRNVQGTQFDDVSAKAGPAFSHPIVGRSVATGDIDNDGGIDIVITDAEGQPLLLRNTMVGRGHWISVKLENSGANRDAIGARITVESAGGKQIRDVSASGSFLAANDVRAHFGLGADTQVTKVSIRWPDGVVEEFGQQGVDRQLTFRRGSAKTAGH